MDKCEQHEKMGEKLSGLDKEVSLNKERIANVKEEQQEIKGHLNAMDGKLDAMPETIRKLIPASNGLSGKQMTALISIVLALIKLIEMMVVNK